MAFCIIRCPTFAFCADGDISSTDTNCQCASEIFRCFIDSDMSALACISGGVK